MTPFPIHRRGDRPWSPSSPIASPAAGLRSGARGALRLWYNSATMPTPFIHLRVVAPLTEPAGEWLPPAIADLLSAHRGPFFLGSTAPDVRRLSDQLTRRATHFSRRQACRRDCRGQHQPAAETMLAAYPSLARPHGLAPEQQAFVAGYIAHLWLDRFWRRQLSPHCSRENRRDRHRGRFAVYSLLLGHVDLQAWQHLDPAVGLALQATEPAGWAPFIPDADLINWRDYLARQLEPGGDSDTAAILAPRAGMDPPDFSALVADQARLVKEVFVHLPLEAVEKAYREGRARSAEIITAYLDDGRGKKPQANPPLAPALRPRLDDLADTE